VNFVHQFNNLKSSYHFLKKFSLAALARLRLILHLEMKACNVLYQLQLYFFFFWGSLSLTGSFQNSLKNRINCTKMRIQCPKIVCWGGRKRGWGRRENGGNSAMAVWGDIDASGYRPVARVI